MALIASEELLGAFLPIAVFWIYSGLYVVFDPYLDRYRIHTKEEETRNMVSKLEIIKGIFMEQIVQLVLVLLSFKLNGDGGVVKPQPSIPVMIGQILVAMVVMDTYLYFFHRLCHTSKFFYKHLHSQHHKVFVPFPYVGQYNHPVESALVHVGGVLAFLASGMTMRTSTIFYCFATIKGVDDHCGFYIPWHPIQRLFEANSVYHDVHHQLDGLKSNFSTPFFTFWDRLLGTYLPYELGEREGGGYEVKRSIKKD